MGSGQQAGDSGQAGAEQWLLQLETIAVVQEVLTHRGG